MDARRCPACGENKPLDQFHVKKRYADRIIYSAYCIPCGREYRRDHYRQNKEYYLRKEAARKRRIKEMVREAKARPCADCGVQYASWQMDFDHVRGAKLFGLSMRLGGNYSIKKVRAEIAKCDVVCANCHRDRTHMRLLAGKEGC
jgi:hypothetical protein